MSDFFTTTFEKLLPGDVMLSADRAWWSNSIVIAVTPRRRLVFLSKEEGAYEALSTGVAWLEAVNVIRVKR